MSSWVNYQELRQKIDFGRVLQDYGVELKAHGKQGMAFCPLPGHKERSKQKSRSFSANLGRGIFQCFGCQAKGNVIDFVALMEGQDPGEREQFRNAALLLQARYLEGQGEDRPAPRTVEAPKEESAVGDAQEENFQRLINQPLEFELKSIDAAHPYLARRGLHKHTISHFGLGYCSKGLMKGRVVVPLHDAAGQLIGYAGRLVDDAAVNDEQPKYLFPGDRKKGEVILEFRKGEFLFNGFRQHGAAENLIVVEGFFDTFRLHQAGYTSVVALMGASCTENQAALLRELVRPGGNLFVMPDGNEAGAKMALSVMGQLAAHCFVRWVALEAGNEPDLLDSETLQTVLRQSNFVMQKSDQ